MGRYSRGCPKGPNRAASCGLMVRGLQMRESQIRTAPEAPERPTMLPTNMSPSPFSGWLPTWTTSLLAAMLGMCRLALSSSAWNDGALGCSCFRSAAWRFRSAGLQLEDTWRYLSAPLAASWMAMYAATPSINFLSRSTNSSYSAAIPSSVTVALCSWSHSNTAAMDSIRCSAFFACISAHISAFCWSVRPSGIRGSGVGCRSRSTSAGAASGSTKEPSEGVAPSACSSCTSSSSGSGVGGKEGVSTPRTLLTCSCSIW
mmetsp:Transcript_111925/g.194327  ORF Transcript_111925/g.194327 Transcript_111925/m.194327 type:complete len:259 (+) Transcript_111925:1904-2680(+)